MRRSLEVVSILLVAYVVFLIIGLLVNVIHNFTDSLRFLWTVLAVEPFHLLSAALLAAFHYLVAIIAAAISVAAAIGATFINVRFMAAEFRKLHVRLDRGDKQNLFVAFFLMLLPTLLAVLYLFAEAKEFTIRSLFAICIGIFCVARLLILFESLPVRRLSLGLCCAVIAFMGLSGLIWLNRHTTFDDMPFFVFAALTQVDKWEGRLTFYGFGALTLTLATLVPIWVKRANHSIVEG